MLIPVDDVAGEVWTTRRGHGMAIPRSRSSRAISLKAGGYLSLIPVRYPKTFVIQQRANQQMSFSHGQNGYRSGHRRVQLRSPSQPSSRSSNADQSPCSFST